VVFFTGALKQDPDLAATLSPCFPKLFPPFYQLVFGHRGLIGWSALDAIARSSITDDFFNLRVLQVLNTTSISDCGCLRCCYDWEATFKALTGLLTATVVGW
jgi:hypothetical protein